MRRKTLWLTFILITVFSFRVVRSEEVPHIGYAYPAGGQQGSSFEVEVGGQYLNGVSHVRVSGGGVQVEVEHYTVKFERKRLNQMFNQLRNLKEGMDGKEGKELKQAERKLRWVRNQLALLDLPEKVDRENRNAVFKHLEFSHKEQFNPQIAERLRVRVTINKDAVPGDRELRVESSSGLSNPICFQVGNLQETHESEPNDDHQDPELQIVPLPSVINGQIRPGDVDHFRFDAAKGDSIIVDVSARRIIPYLADAVPGWFQAVTALYDEDGNEVAYEDDYKFNPDPVLFFNVPKAGTYTLSVRDSIYRGREDFIYRISIGELPFITSIFPLGGQQGKDADVALDGWNLPQTRLQGNIPKQAGNLRHITVEKDGYRSNPMPFVISDIHNIIESEPNNTDAAAQPVTKPLVINGRIQHSKDIDVFSFSGSKGELISIEVMARRINSPLDSVITLRGPGLEPPIRNDDYVRKNSTHLHLGAGLVTHHADSYLWQKLPETGTYFVEIGDAQAKGGHDYGYRLSIKKSIPDFQLCMEPSGMNIGPGGTAVFAIRAFRQNGFNGKIRLKAENLPDGFFISESFIPEDCDITRLTITAPNKIGEEELNPEITGTGMVEGRQIKRTAVPVDDQMQAFLYRHLVPAHELTLAPSSEPPPLSFEACLPKSGLIELPLGQEVRVGFVGRVLEDGVKGMKLRLDHPPEGITENKGWIGGNKSGGSLVRGSIVLKAEKPLEPGDRISLVMMAVKKKGRDEVLVPAPAIPVKIVKSR
ncbi:MAG TPA: PPC domain-containing protein [Pontiella sp.]